MAKNENFKPKIGTKSNYLYRVYDGDKMIFEGTKGKVTEKFGGDCYQDFRLNRKLNGKYVISAVYDGVEHFPSDEVREKHLRDMNEYTKKRYREQNSKRIADKKEQKEKKKSYTPKNYKPFTFKEEYESIKWHLDRYGNTNIVKWKDKIVAKLKKDGYNFKVEHYVGLDPVGENYKKTKKRVALSLDENSFDRDSIDNEDWIITLI